MDLGIKLRVEETLSDVVSFVNNAGYPLKLGMVEDSMSKTKDLEAFQYLKKYLSVVSETPARDFPSSLDKLKSDLRKFLKIYGLRLADTGFLDQLLEEDILEVYTLHHQQIFRSPNFFKISSYELNTLVFTSWSDLFYRHRRVVEDIVQVIGEVTDPDDPIANWNMPPIEPHILKECCFGHNRAIHYKMKRVGCVLDSKLDAPMAYISVLDAEVVDDSKILVL